MTEYEKNKIIGIINGMSEEEREVVIFALNKLYGVSDEDEEKYPYSIVNSIYS